jgi:hypothetical protein
VAASRKPREGLVGRLIQGVEDRTGLTTVPVERLNYLEEAVNELGAVRKELDLLGYTVLDYFGGRPQDATPQQRRSMAQKARYAWMNDPVAGAAVNKINDFTFGRGVPKPRAKDEEVQKVLDEAWEDHDNQRVLTSFQAQMELSTDLCIQNNLFFLMFDEGEDGKVKLSVLNHDSIENAVTDPENRLRVLWYLAKEKKQKWDYKQDRLDMESQATPPKTVYYQHWKNLEVAQDEDREEPLDMPEPQKRGEGKVYHLANNKGMEQVFGVPEFQRLLRWISALNSFMEARIDMAKAAAAFIMQRKIKGTPDQLVRMASKALSHGSEIGSSYATAYSEETGMVQPPRPASIANVNENASLEPLRIDSGAAAASQDAQMLRAQVSAGTGWTQAYFGDASNSNLATATSLELPILKMIESRQEWFEQVFRWFFDRAIQRAVETGRLSETVEPEPVEPAVGQEEEQVTGTPGQTPGQAPSPPSVRPGLQIAAAMEDKADAEEETQRDLSYEFSMPSPLRRMMADLVGAIAQIAQVFDPNNTNVNLSRALLTIALGEGLEVADPAELVDQVFPEGYVDPALAAAQAAAAGGGGGGNFFGPESSDMPPDAENAYGAPKRSTPPERVPGAQEAALVRGRDGSVIQEVRFKELPDLARVSTNRRKTEEQDEWDEEVTAVAVGALESIATTPHSNGAEPK